MDSLRHIIFVEWVVCALPWVASIKLLRFVTIGRWAEWKFKNWLTKLRKELLAMQTTCLVNCILRPARHPPPTLVLSPGDISHAHRTLLLSLPLKSTSFVNHGKAFKHHWDRLCCHLLLANLWPCVIWCNIFNSLRIFNFVSHFICVQIFQIDLST